MSTIAEAARDYFDRRKWKPVPVSRQTKKAMGKGWQKRPYNPAQFNGNAQNVGIQFGDPSGGLCDVDLDAMSAIGFAPEFLPETGAVFGRRSKPCSHQLYVSDLHKTETRAAIQYPQYIGKKPGPMIVELRIGGNGKGATTVVPPSMHETGEMVEWARDGEPAQVAGDELICAVRKLAVAVLLKPHYPGEGSRHGGALVIGGVLARAGWSADDIAHVVTVIARAAGDDDVRDRVTAAAGAVTAKANGHDVAGFERLREVWGDEVADTLVHWLKARDLRGDKDGGLEDRVALDFAAKHADELRHIAETSQWMHWTGTYWQAEKTHAAFDKSRQLCRAAGDARAKTVAAVVTLARTDRRLVAVTEQWDTHPMLLQTTRTTVDLRTGLEQQPDRSHYITKQTSTYLAPPGTPHKLWSGFLDIVTDADERLIGFLQRFAGYCLTGLTREHKFAFFFGPGGNGKGVFANTLVTVMGDYAITAPMEMFLASKYERHPTEIARLKGARLVVAQETQKGRRWDETKLKALTGGDRLSGRLMRQDYFDFDATHKLLITGNHKPSLSAVNEAIRRRLMLTLFNKVIEDPDPDFAAKLMPEHPAILRWMVDGCLEWQRDGLGVPSCVQKASDEYFANQDTLEQWLDDCVDTTDLRAFTTSRVLFTSWKIWSEARGMSAGMEKAFVDALADKGYAQKRYEYGRGFNGLKLYANDRGPPVGEGSMTGHDGSSIIDRIGDENHDGMTGRDGSYQPTSPSRARARTHDTPDNGRPVMTRHAGGRTVDEQSETVASVKFMITAEEKRRLRIFGYSDEQIRGMRPDEAQRILTQNNASVAVAPLMAFEIDELKRRGFSPDDLFGMSPEHARAILADPECNKLIEKYGKGADAPPDTVCRRCGEPGARYFHEPLGPGVRSDRFPGLTALHLKCCEKYFESGSPDVG